MKIFESSISGCRRCYFLLLTAVVCSTLVIYLVDWSAEARHMNGHLIPADLLPRASEVHYVSKTAAEARHMDEHLIPADLLPRASEVYNVSKTAAASTVFACDSRILTSLGEAVATLLLCISNVLEVQAALESSVGRDVLVYIEIPLIGEGEWDRNRKPNGKKVNLKSN